MNKTPAQSELRILALHALGIALGYAKAKTMEEGNNAGDQIEFFQKTTGGSKGDSWCCDFVYACFLKAWCLSKGLLIGITDENNRLSMLRHADEFTAMTKIPRTGYCPTMAAAAVKQFRFRSKQFTPVAGDVVLFDFKAQGEPHHIEFIRSVTVDGMLATIGGNTSSGDAGSQGDGQGVFLRTRDRSHVYGFISFG